MRTAAALGIRPNDPTAARPNSAAVAASRYSILFDHAAYFFETPFPFKPNGGELIGVGGGGLRVSRAAQFNDDNPLFMIGTRFETVNPANDKDFLVLCGACQKVRDIAIHGRQWSLSNTPPTGPRTRSCIAFEGRSTPPAGRHTIDGCLLADADVGMATLRSPVEDHADLIFVQNTYVSACRAFFQSNNLQSVSHTFVHCFQESDDPCVGFEYLRGGKIGAFGFYQNSDFCTLASVRDDCAPNCNSLIVQDYQWDHIGQPGSYFCPLDTDKPSLTGGVYGHANNPQAAYECRDAGLLRNPRFRFEVAHLRGGTK